MTRAEREHRTDLGLAIAHAACLPGQRRTLEEIASFCACRNQNIRQIEQRALRKLRKALFFRRDPVLIELVESVIHRHPEDAR